MHKAIRAGVLLLPSILLIVANLWSTAHAAADRSPLPGSAVGYNYTVQPTDSLWGIAVAHRITVQALIAANDLADPRLLRPGQTLWVPASPPEIAKPSASAASQGASSAPAGGSSSTLPPGKESWPTELLRLINEKRAEAGLPALAWSPALAQAAQAHSEDCARRDQGNHRGSDGAPLESRLTRVGLAPRWASENWANAQSVQHAFALWWNEAPGRDPHRRNILNQRYTEIGIGIAVAQWGTYFVADFAGE